MIFVPKITYSKSPELVSREDHCLVVLPTTNGRTDFVSVRTYDQFLEYFGTEFHKPEEVDHSTEVVNYLKSDEEYSEGLLNTIRFLLNNGVPLLVTTASVSTKASVRFYALDNEEYNICSISHNDISIFKNDNIINNLKSFISLDHLKNYEVNKTLVHRIPLHTKILEDGTKISEVPDPSTFTEEEKAAYRGWFITLPVQKHKIVDDKIVYNNAVLSYVIYLNNSDKKDYSDLYSSTAPIFDGKEVAVLNCAGTYEQLVDSISHINTLLQKRYEDECIMDNTINNYRLILDWEHDSIIALSNQYIPFSAVNSLPYDDEFYPDLNDSGWIMEKFTQPYAYLDIISNYTGDIGNLFNVNFLKSDNRFLVRTSYGASIYDYTDLYEIDREFTTTTDYIKIVQYPSKILSDGSIRNILFDGIDSLVNQKIIQLFGGVNSDSVTYEAIENKIIEYSDLDDTYPLNFIFDCMSESQGFIHSVGKRLLDGSFSNKNITLLANCYTPEVKTDIDAIIKPLKLNILYYHPYLVYNTRDEKVALAAYIIMNLMKDNFIPTLNIIGYKDYLESITPSSDNQLFGNDKWDYVNYPLVNGSYIYLNEMKLARCTYEESIDVYLSSKLYNDLTILFEPLVGETRDDEELFELAHSYLNYCDVCPTLIDRFELTNFERVRRSLTITISAYRQELAGGTRILNININL